MTKHQHDLQRLLSAVAEQAHARLISIRRTNGGHVQARFDRGAPLFTGSTPSDWRSIKNFKAQAKRALRGVA
jgi:hypothetical protein